MGYTHYWTWGHQRPGEEAVKACVADMKKVLDDACVGLLAGPLGDSGTEPVVTDTEIAFNGVGEESHETFRFPGYFRGDTWPNYYGDQYDPEGFNFCKTARKPYDVIVCACLLVASCHFGEDVLVIDSDGRGEERYEDEDWSGLWHAGVEYFESIFPDHGPCPLIEKMLTPDGEEISDNLFETA